ncbi:MAG: chorismate-binding protein [Candidatus Omnitrophica bacterium]|nr:chorismate-binding protein [Candidatus Omnitrophota bacterium]
MIYPGKQEFIKLAKKANVIPVYKEILADTLTPVSAFQKIGKGYSYLLESVEGLEKIARFSFIGAEPSMILKIKENSVEMNKSGKVKKYSTEEPLKEIEKIMSDFKAAEKKTSLGFARDKKIKSKKYKIESNFTKIEFENLVRKAKEYIRAGDIIQVVPSQRFHAKLGCEPFDVYRALRSLNPSPYMYYLNFNDIKLVGSSPELLVRCENGIVETRPIAGTRPRGRNEAEDKKLEKELLADAKERAEHVMLIDLGRNDIGRVCKPGSVKVTDFMFIERYSHVMHIVSNCRGILDKNKNAFDVLRACFPAGTVSGAPKVRAMEIIDELENTKRSYYAGAVGYFSFSGNMDTCITIRTMLVKDRDAFIQAGGGIVADSIPSREYQETVNKAKAMVRAIEIAEQGLL